MSKVIEITVAWLEAQSACADGIEWFKSQKETNTIKVLEALCSDDKSSYANWLVVRLLNRKDQLRYAIFAAEQVIGIFEQYYPEDKRPRHAIEAAKAVLRSDTKKNRDAAESAASAAESASAAWSAAESAASSAAESAYYAAYAAAYAAANAAASAAADSTVEEKMKVKIIRHGIGLLKKAQKSKKGGK